MKRQEKDNWEKILNYKKAQFLNAVEKSAKYLGFRTPQVIFWETKDTNHFNTSERAHIHIETNTICIPETELEVMNKLDLEETASHEVSHLKNLGHDTDFQNTKENAKAGIWRPPSGEGILALNGGERVESSEEKPKKERIDKARCNYHLCRKKTQVSRCPFCEKYFCAKHVKSRDVSLPSTENEEENTHPCWAYTHYENKKREESDESYEESLSKMFRKDSRMTEEHKEKPKKNFNLFKKIKDFFYK